MKIKLLLVFLASFLINTINCQSTFQWAKGFGSATSDRAHSVSTDISGNVYATGFFTGTVDFDPGPGVFTLSATASSYDIFLTKLNASGNFIWAIKIGGKGSDYGLDIANDVLGYTYLTGSFMDTVDFNPGPGVYNLISQGNADAYICKINPAGNFVWAKKFGTSTPESSYSIALDTLGNVHATGYFTGSVDFNPGPSTNSLTTPTGFYDAFVLKMDSAGSYIWAVQFTGPSSEYGNAITVDKSGNVYTTGEFFSTTDFDPGVGTFTLSTSTSKTAAFVSKLNSSGNFVWARKFDGIFGDEKGFSIAVDASGNVYTCGEYYQSADFDPSAVTNNLTAAGFEDVYVSKLNSSGNFVWARSMGGGSQDKCYGLALDSAKNVYTTGGYFLQGDFDPGPGTYTLSSAGGTEIFISKLDSTGAFIWASSIGSVAFDHGLAICTKGANVYIAGLFGDVADFDPGSGVYNLSPTPGSEDAFVLKLGSGISTGEISKSLNNEHLNIYPNPFNNKITVTYTGANETLQIFNTLGALIYSVSIENEKIEIDLSNQASGIYFMRIENYTTKLIKE